MKKLISICIFLVSCANPNFQNPAPTENQQIYTTEELQIEVLWDSSPSTSVAASFVLKIVSKFTLMPMNLNKNPSIMLWMPSMGHGSAPVSIENIGIGIYTVKNIYFIMSGDWEVRMKLDDKNEIIHKLTL